MVLGDDFVFSYPSKSQRPFQEEKDFFLAQLVGLREVRVWPQLKQPFHQETSSSSLSTEIKLCRDTQERAGRKGQGG